jgi:parallel beta-helix repeat protein
MGCIDRFNWWVFLLSLLFSGCSTGNVRAGIIEVPGDQPSLQAAIEVAVTGDTIVMDHGTYYENLSLTKKLVIGSRFLRDGDVSHIAQTIIDGSTSAVFTISLPKEDTSVLVGLTIQNGEDGIMASAPVDLYNNMIQDCGDGIDYETGGSGTLRNNTFRNNLDDGIDLDGTLYHVVIENNIICDNNDDGIEIRLHNYEGDSAYCFIRDNAICRNGEDGIQFIDYPDTTNRIYYVVYNLICDNEMVGVGCMENGVTVEDYHGAAIPETIVLMNNTISGNNFGITGGATLLAANNVIMNSTGMGVKNLAGNSLLSYSLFFSNGTDVSNSNIDGATVIYDDPMLNSDFVPVLGSPCIDRGLALLVCGGDTLFRVREEDYFGASPDIGAKENRGETTVYGLSCEQPLSLYPNPVRDILIIDIGNGLDGGKLQILDCTGSVLIARKVDAGKMQMSLQSLVSGIYFLRLRISDRTLLQKIVKI